MKKQKYGRYSYLMGLCFRKRLGEKPVNNYVINSLYEKLLQISSIKSLDDPYGVIARFVLANFDHIQDYSLLDLALSCSVSKATVSRFVREAGADNYSDFRQQALAEQRIFPNQYNWSHPKSALPFLKPYCAENTESLMQRISSDLKKIFTVQVLSLLEELATEMISHTYIYIYGMRYSQIFYQHLKNELITEGMQYILINSPAEIQTPAAENLTIIFSIFGFLIQGMDDQSVYELDRRSDSVWLLSSEYESRRFRSICFPKTDYPTSSYLSWLLAAEQLICLCKHPGLIDLESAV